jgi:hypothetical protein
VATAVIVVLSGAVATAAVATAAVATTGVATSAFTVIFLLL